MIEVKPPETSRESGGLFIAGGITGCPDWQSEFVYMLSDTNFTIFNPRRDDFDTSDFDMSKEQIEWEYEHLKRAALISFWFSKETLCPITLFELGTQLQRRHLAQIVIGIEPSYQREFDVRLQTALVDEHTAIHKRVPIFSNLRVMASFLKGYKRGSVR